MNIAHEPIALPVFKKRHWPFPLIWIVPAITAVVAGYYLKDYFANKGPEIVINFSDASGLREGETRIVHKGAEIGRVTGIELSENHHHALVHATLRKSEDAFASKGTLFWIVRPEISEAGLKGLGTLFTGPYIDAIPGKSEELITEVDGLSHSPKPYEEGEKFTLTTPKLGHVEEGSGVYYKGIQVGSVQDIELSNEADHLNVHILVWTRYAELVRTNSKFWIQSGFDFKGGLLTGAELKLESLREVVSGGIGFASPEKDMGAHAKPGRYFAIENEIKKEWEEWSPHISVSPRSSDSVPKPTELPVAKRGKKN